jgi:hypothetical protein
MAPHSGRQLGPSNVVVRECLVEWWGWLVVVVGVIVILVGLFIGLQARRRRGGVIVGPASGTGRAASDDPGHEGTP